jgi:hypothetical protein
MDENLRFARSSELNHWQCHTPSVTGETMHNQPQNPALEAFVSTLEAVAQSCDIRRLGVSFETQDSVRMVGEYHGITLVLSVHGIKRRAPRTVLSLDTPGVVIDLSVRPELSGERIDKALGMTVDIEVGDAVFDQRFVVEACPAEVVPVVLTRRARAAMMAVRCDHEYPKIEVRQGTASFVWGALPDPATLQHALSTLVAIREEICALREGTRTLTAGHAFRHVEAGAETVDPSERDSARTRLRRARTRVAMVLGSAVVTGVGFLATVILQRFA